LNLAEARLKWREKDGAAKALRQLDTIWSAAQTNFAGPDREKDWLDWTTRRAAARAEFQTRVQNRALKRGLRPQGNPVFGIRGRTRPDRGGTRLLPRECKNRHGGNFATW
jgi:hypothetical protein